MAEKLKRLVCTSLCGLLLLSGCSRGFAQKPEIESIRNIAYLSTIKAYFHNVAILNKEAGTGIAHWGETDREYWIPYTGIVTYGIDFSKVRLEESGDVYVVHIPGAQVQNVDIDSSTFNEENMVKTRDNWWNRNPFTPEDQVKGLKDAQKEMELNAWQNQTMMQNAQNRAADLITGYISAIASASGTVYEVKVEYDENVIPESIQKQIQEAENN